jgi:hypothetical protein
MGFAFGLKQGQVRTLVYKLGGRNDSKRDVWKVRILWRYWT